MNNREMPLISVVVPVFGTEKYLRKCLDSILEQTYKNIELIVVNDGSKDNSEMIIKEYLNKFKNIKYVRHKKNKGLFQARVSGAEEATGEYIAFVDSDDYISRDFYRLLVKKCIDNKADIAVANTVFEDVDGTQTIRQLYQLCFGKEMLIGEEIKFGFLKQEGYCFSWHTVWNKLYKKNLWDKCMPFYQNMGKHIVMTEDIAFSTLILCNAACMVQQYNAHYFYCKHPDASTDSSDITFEKFEKNIEDIKYVFDFVDAYLKDMKLEKERTLFLRFREKYSRMWRTLQQNRFPQNKEAISLIDEFLPQYKKTQRDDEFCFDVVAAPYNGGLEYAKSLISDSKIKVVSFDIFDTLVIRPFYKPEDLFYLMNRTFDQITNNSIGMSFNKIRVLAEKMAREKSNSEDITLHEIYTCMMENFGLSNAIFDQMYELEKEYELRFCSARNAGKELFEVAEACGKQIVLTSDMYLEYETVEQILHRCGYNGYVKLFLSSKERCLKANGHLFERVLRELKLKPDRVLHIGDNWTADIVGAGNEGIKTFFLPKAIEVFENIIDGVKTNECAWTDKYIWGPFLHEESARKTVGYRCMLALVANKFFDNPFVSFNEKSDFNANPYMLGYYNLGTHCIGVAKWIESECNLNQYKKIFFLARDGYLFKQTFDLYSKAKQSKVKSYYIQGSRTTALPYMIKNKYDLYDLPIESNNHTPLSVCKMLSFCIDVEQPLEKSISDSGFAPSVNLQNEKNYHAFIRYVIEQWFSEEKLKESQEALKKYYDCVTDNSVLFDMGYSGRIQQAISRAVEKPIDALYIHADNDRSFLTSQKEGFRIRCYYNGCPASTGVLREYLLSDASPSCKYIRMQDGDVNCVYEKDTTKFPEKFVLERIHAGAIDFSKDFIRIFSGLLDTLDFESRGVSSAFEYYLRFAKKADRKFLTLCELEDKCYGNLVSVRADRFFNNQLYSITRYMPPANSSPDNMVDLEAKFCLEDDQAESEIEIEIEEKGDLTEKVAGIIYDKISVNDSKEDKFAKCVDNTNNIVDWTYLTQNLVTRVYPSWTLQNDNPNEFVECDSYITTALSHVEENSDLTYLEKIMDKIGDKVLLPVGIGFSTQNSKTQFVLNEKSKSTLKKIAERCEILGVKGEYSAEVLENMGIKNVEIIGMPAMYRNIEQMKAIKNSSVINSISAGFRPLYGKLTIKEKKLLGYMMQNKFEWIDTSSMSLQKNIMSDDKNYAQIKEWEKQKKVFFDLDSWEDHIRKMDFSMGLGFYNNMLAIQNSIPALFITSESIGRELCKYYKLPYIELEAFDDKKRVEDYYQKADFDQFIKKIAECTENYHRYLEKNGINISNIMDRVIEK